MCARVWWVGWWVGGRAHAVAAAATAQGMLGSLWACPLTGGSSRPPHATDTGSPNSQNKNAENKHSSHSRPNTQYSYTDPSSAPPFPPLGQDHGVMGAQHPQRAHPTHRPTYPSTHIHTRARTPQNLPCPPARHRTLRSFSARIMVSWGRNTQPAVRSAKRMPKVTT